MYGRGGRLCELPQGRGAVVAQHRRVSACEHRGDPPALLAELLATDGVDAAMDRVQPAVLDPVVNRLRRIADRDELLVRDDAALLAGECPGAWLVS